MDITVKLEKKQKFDEEEIHKELEEKVNFDVLKRKNVLPSLTELLYGQTEESMMSMKEMLFGKD